MLTDHQHLRSGQRDHLRTQQSEFSITDNCNAIAFRNRSALKNSTRRRQRFSKHCLLLRNTFRNGNEVYLRQLQKLSVCTIATDDSQHSA